MFGSGVHPTRADLDGYGCIPDDFLTLFECCVGDGDRRHGFLTSPENSAAGEGSSGVESMRSDLEGQWGQGMFRIDPSRMPGLGASGAVNAILLLDIYLFPTATLLRLYHSSSCHLTGNFSGRQRCVEVNQVGVKVIAPRVSLKTYIAAGRDGSGVL
ncbi:hypothetical protein NL676_029172 [Syzygium grande]|nr:hypothetical protein NL676_029172 [Syzygium grande]